MEKVPFYRKVLLDAFAEKCSRNSKYSLRAFSNFLGMNSSTVSQIMNGKRMLSEKMADRIFLKLHLPFESKEEFLHSLSITKMRMGHRRFSKVLKRKIDDQMKSENHELSAETFKVISDWYHYAIMALTFVDDFEPSPSWIAKQLHLNEGVVAAALDRLLEMGLLKESNGTLVMTKRRIDTQNKSITTPALKKRQKQILEKSIHSLESDPIELRNHSAMTMAIDPARLPEAKKKIQKFQQEMSLFLESGHAQKVYEMSITLFPLQTTEVH